MAGEPRGKLLGGAGKRTRRKRRRTVIVRIGVQTLPQPERGLTSVWCSCRGSALEIHRREACERPVSLRFSALRPRVGTNQQCDACEGLVRSGRTGISTALNAVRERSAAKVGCFVLRGPCFRKERGYPLKLSERVRPPLCFLAFASADCALSSSRMLSTPAIPIHPSHSLRHNSQRNFIIWRYTTDIELTINNRHKNNNKYINYKGRKSPIAIALFL